MTLEERLIKKIVELSQEQLDKLKEMLEDEYSCWNTNCKNCPFDEYLKVGNIGCSSLSKIFGEYKVLVDFIPDVLEINKKGSNFIKF